MFHFVTIQYLPLLFYVGRPFGIQAENPIIVTVLFFAHVVSNVWNDLKGEMLHYVYRSKYAFVFSRHLYAFCINALYNSFMIPVLWAHTEVK